MKILRVLFLLFLPLISLGQLDDRDRIHHEEYEADAVYFQLKPGYQLGSKDIVARENPALKSYSELQSLFDQQVAVAIRQEFKILANKHEPFSRIYRVEIAPQANLDEVVETLEALPYMLLSEKIPLNRTFLTPNDPDYSDSQKRWHLDQIDAELAWDIVPGCGNVLIAVVDDAVMTNHEDLQANIYVNSGEIPNNGIDDDNNGYIDDVSGFDVSDNDPNASPPGTATANYFSHGTHVAGIASGVSNNGLGTASLGFSCPLLPVKCKSDQNTIPGVLDNAMQGVEYAIAAGADVINMSWGSYAWSAVNQQVFNLANTLDITCVAAVGNDGLPFTAYPANYNPVISVIATNQSDDKAVFSNFSNDYHVFAPGVDMWSAVASSTSSYGYKSGTSMASPLVAALVGLMKCNSPGIQRFQILQCIEDGADLVPSPTITAFDVPRINAVQSLQCNLPVAINCEPAGCELIFNGDFETPAFTNFSTYQSFGGINAGQSCGWDDYPSTVDLFPLSLSAPDHYAHLQCYEDSSSNFRVFEGLMTAEPLELIPGQQYKLQFDYTVMKDATYDPTTDRLDSIAVKLIQGSQSLPQAFGSFSIPVMVLGAILQPTVDHTHTNWSNWINNAARPAANEWHHYQLVFTAPMDTSFNTLVIHPTSLYPQIGFLGIVALGLDNISLRPEIDITGSVSDPNPQWNDCITLQSITTANQVYWEPAHLFADPTLPSQNICLDTVDVCPGEQFVFMVTAMDSALGCTSSDSVIVNISPSSEPVPMASTLPAITACEPIFAIDPPLAIVPCGDTVLGTPDVTFPISQSGVITWEYTDSTGNTVYQTQQVIIPSIDVSTTLMGNSVSANQAGASYQWIDCSTGQPIPNETNQTFTPSASGIYAVEITLEGCVDTSECIGNVGIDQLQMDQNLSIVPNPTSGNVYVSLGTGTIQEILVMDVSGRMIQTKKEIRSSQYTLDFSDLSSGMYFVKVNTDRGMHSHRVIVE